MTDHTLYGLLTGEFSQRIFTRSSEGTKWQLGVGGMGVGGGGRYLLHRPSLNAFFHTTLQKHQIDRTDSPGARPGYKLIFKSFFSFFLSWFLVQDWGEIPFRENSLNVLNRSISGAGWPNRSLTPSCLQRKLRLQFASSPYLHTDLPTWRNTSLCAPLPL